MTPAPDLSALSLPELRALNVALGVAIAAVKGTGGAASGQVDCALMADAEGVSVTFTILINQDPEP